MGEMALVCNCSRRLVEVEDFARFFPLPTKKGQNSFKNKLNAGYNGRKGFRYNTFYTSSSLKVCCCVMTVKVLAGSYRKRLTVA
jgi:hypothetical protein